MDMNTLKAAFAGSGERQAAEQRFPNKPRAPPDPAPAPRLQGLDTERPKKTPKPPKSAKAARSSKASKSSKGGRAAKAAKNAKSPASSSGGSGSPDDTDSGSGDDDYGDWMEYEEERAEGIAMIGQSLFGQGKKTTSGPRGSRANTPPRRTPKSDAYNKDGKPSRSEDNDDGDKTSGDDDDDDDDESDSDSAEEALRHSQRRRSKKTKPVAVPEMNTAFRVDTTRGPQNSVPAPDVLRGERYNPSLAQRVCALYENAIWLPDSNTAPQLFERDLMMQQGKCSIPDVSFADPRNYEIIQEMLKRHPRNKLDKDDGKNTVMLKKVPVVTREYEQSQLRSPRGQERACVNGKDCMCNRKYGFTMKEFLLPDDLEKLHAHSQVDVAVMPCVLCLRDTTAYISLHIAATSFAPLPDYIVQSYRNLVDIEGEYRFEDCLMTGPGIPYPVVMNKTNGYEMRTDGEEYYLLQNGYAAPDFRRGALQTGRM